MTEPSSLAAPQLEELAKTLTYHQDQADLHTKEAARIEAEIRTILKAPTSVDFGTFKIDWTGPKRTFQAKEFVAAYPPAKNQHMYKLVPDGDAIPKNLKERFYKTGSGAGTVKIK